MKIAIETKQVKNINEMVDPSTGRRSINMVYIEAVETNRCVIRVMTEDTNAQRLIRLIAAHNLYLPVERIDAQRT